MPADKEKKTSDGEQNNRDKVISALICLVGCAVNEAAPDCAYLSKFTPDDFRSLYSLSASLSLNSITYTALERTPGFEIPQIDLFRRWKDRRDREIYKSLMFDQAWEKLRLFFEENGIWYLLLKGLPMKKFYPEPGMRQMADVDVLYDENFGEKVRDYFVSQGYRVENYNSGNADAYLKPPFYNFELHRRLFSHLKDSSEEEYFKGVKDRMILNNGSSYGYHLKDEDFYIYVTAHADRHFHTDGTGLRNLLDVYVYLKAKEESLDWEYIRGELVKLSLTDFERSCRELSRKLFSCDAGAENLPLSELSDEEQAFLSEFLSFGTYGTMSNRIRNGLQAIADDGQPATAGSKLKYLWHRAFPEKEELYAYYPFFARHKWLTPVGYLYRLISKAITKNQNMMEELRALKKKK